MRRKELIGQASTNEGSLEEQARVIVPLMAVS